MDNEKTNAALETRTADLKKQLMMQLHQGREGSPAPSHLPLSSQAVAPNADGSGHKGSEGSAPNATLKAVERPQLQANDNDIAAFIADISAKSASSPEGVPMSSLQSTRKTVSFGFSAPAGNAGDKTAAKSTSSADSLSLAQSEDAALRMVESVPVSGSQKPADQPTSSGPDTTKLASSAMWHMDLSAETAVSDDNTNGARPENQATVVHESLLKADTALPSGSLGCLAPAPAVIDGVSQKKKMSEVNSISLVGSAMSRLSPGPEYSNCPSLEESRDLQDWLVFTNFYDMTYRAQFLSRRRRLAALELERQKLLEEMEEEAAQISRRQFSSPALPQPGHLHAPARSLSTPLLSGTFTSPAPSAVSIFNSTSSRASSPVTAPYIVAQPSAPSDERKFLSQTWTNLPSQSKNPMKRAYEAEGAKDQKGQQQRPNKLVRTEADTEIAAGAEAARGDKRNVPTKNTNGIDRKTTNVQVKLPEELTEEISCKSPSPHQSTSTNQPFLQGAEKASSPPMNSLRLKQYKDYELQRTREAPKGQDKSPSRFKLAEQRGDHDIQHRYSDHGEFGGRRSDNVRTASPKKKSQGLDLGKRGDTRFFMVKSFNDINVTRSMQDGIWTTQLKNGEVLMEAFKQCRNVILFFSVNKSRAFQGYARMASEPTDDLPRPAWMKNIHWETTPPFRLEWMNTSTMGYNFVHHLKNSLNENRSVTIGKDGQEIEEECARSLLKEMNLYSTSARDSSPVRDCAWEIDRFRGGRYRGDDYDRDCR